MRQLTVSFVILLLAAASIVGGAGNHVKLLQDTVRPLQVVAPNLDPESTTVLFKNVCTIFSVHPEHHGWMTAAHCLVDPVTGDLRAGADDWYIAGHPARIVDISLTHDIALLQTPEWAHPTGLKLGARRPEQGDVVSTLGYAWGKEHPFYFVGTVASQAGLPSFIISAMITISGMSGGPLIDSDGFVVGVVHVSIGGTPFTDADPLLGSTPYDALLAYDAGWIFAR